MKTQLTILLSLTFLFLFIGYVNGEDDSGLCIGKCMVIESYDDEDLLKDIFFEFDNYDLSDNAKSTLNKNVAYLKSNPSLKIEIQGHCDERGVNNYNIALGERRAQSTKQYLVSQGVDSSNVKAIAYGEEKPFCFESNGTCWQQNRRAHFIVTK
jgi:peptidoglycan-associated lipoprotein